MVSLLDFARLTLVTLQLPWLHYSYAHRFVLPQCLAMLAILGSLVCLFFLPSLLASCLVSGESLALETGASVLWGMEMNWVNQVCSFDCTSAMWC